MLLAGCFFTVNKTKSPYKAVFFCVWSLYRDLPYFISFSFVLLMKGFSKVEYKLFLSYFLFSQETLKHLHLHLSSSTLQKTLKYVGLLLEFSAAKETLEF